MDSKIFASAVQTSVARVVAVVTLGFWLMMPIEVPRTTCRWVLAGTGSGCESYASFWPSPGSFPVLFALGTVAALVLFGALLYSTASPGRWGEGFTGDRNSPAESPE